MAAFKFPNGVSIDPGQTITVSDHVMRDHMMSCDTAVGVGAEERHDAQSSARLCLARQTELVHRTKYHHIVVSQ